jgi:hypothetical protein
LRAQQIYKQGSIFGEPINLGPVAGGNNKQRINIERGGLLKKGFILFAADSKKASYRCICFPVVDTGYKEF